MIRNLLTLLLLALAAASYAQPTYQGTPATKVVNRGLTGADSGLVITPSDTFNHALPIGTMRFTSGNVLRVFTGTTWRKVNEADLAGVVKYSDTSALLSPYAKGSALADSAAALRAFAIIAADTASLSARINGRLKISDTTLMLGAYARKSALIDSAAALRALAGSAGGAIDTTSLSTRINARLKHTDTAAMLSTYAKSLALADTAAALRAIAGSGGTAIDTSSLSARINARLKYSDTAATLLPYARKSALNDTAAALRAALASVPVTDTLGLSSRINQRVRYTDTAAMLNPYQRKGSSLQYADTGALMAPFQRAATAMKYADTAAMLSVYLRSAYAAVQYAPVSTTVTLSGPQTLTNKTLTAPVLSAPAVTGLSSGTVSDSLLVADPSTGTVKRISSARIGGGAAVKYVANVKDYGALGNGTTNDRAAFKAAIATGMDVYVPASANGYALDSTVTLQSGQAIFGDGANSKIIFQNPYASGFYMVKAVGYNNISNLQFFIGLKPTWIGDNPDLWTTGAVYLNGFGNQVHNCWFKTISGAGIFIQGTQTLIDGCFVDDNVCGILVNGEYNHIQGLTGSANRRAAYFTTGNNTFSGGNFSGGGGLYYNGISNGDHTSVVGCTFNHMSDPSFEGKNVGVGLNIIGCNFWDGQIKYNTTNGLHFTGCTIGTSTTFLVAGTNTNDVIENCFVMPTVTLPVDAGIRLVNNFGGSSSKYPRSLDQTADVETGTGGVKYAPVVIDGTTYHIKLETSVP